MKTTFLFITLALMPDLVWSKNVHGKVVGVYDGDSIKVMGNDKRAYRVGLADIDAPERDAPWGGAAQRALADKVFGRRVKVVTSGAGQHDRILGKVYLGDRYINQEMVLEGHAWAYRANVSDESLLDEEDYARTNRIGLWSMPLNLQIKPWEWRRGTRPVIETPNVTAESRE